MNLLLNSNESTIGRWFFRPMIFLLVLLNIVYVMVSPMEIYSGITYIADIIFYISGAIFLIEYVLRITYAPISHPAKKSYISRFRYITSFYGTIDFIAVIPFLIPSLFNLDSNLISLIEVCRILLIFKLLRYSKAFVLLRDVIRNVRDELAISISLSVVVVTFASMAMYYIERSAQPQVFDNIGAGFWWAIITFATVGYGDVVPVTPAGKVLAGFIAMVGIGMIALPTAIISSSLMNIMNKKRVAEELKSRSTEHQHNDPSPDHYQHCPHCGKKL